MQKSKTKMTAIWMVMLFFFGNCKEGGSDSGTAGVADVAGGGSDAMEVIKIGTQSWSTKNLEVSTYRSGDSIPQVQDAAAWASLSTGAWCYYGNKEENGTTYGKLYNWYAVSDPRGLAPEGFHIPSDAEWTVLTDYLGGVLEAGAKMKSASGWYEDGNGSNSSGFAGLPGGSRDGFGAFGVIGLYGGWWSSTEVSTGNARDRILYYANGFVFRGSDGKLSGLSVRCLGD